MGKKTSSTQPGKGEKSSRKKSPQAASTASAIDPTLEALFQTSLTDSTVTLKRQIQHPASDQASDVSADDRTGSEDEAVSASENSAEGRSREAPARRPEPSKESSRHRKRKRDDEDVEERYLRRLAEEQRREEARRGRDATANANAEDHGSAPEDSNDGADSDREMHDAESSPPDEDFETPQHETVASGTENSDLEKANRTVFLSNVSTSAIVSKAARRTLDQHLVSFVSDLPKSDPPHKVESLRFRSTAFATAAIPKRAAFAKKELMEATTKSTNAYVVYTTTTAAREATKRLNGTVVLDRHLRVDSVAHPAPVDHRRCVFVGNLGFVDDESLIRAAEQDESERPHKMKPPADVEEGLWRQFQTAGTVESVRVVRDPKTRVGKGIAYVQFKDENAVERALAFHDKRYPPFLPRPLRVSRARKTSKTTSQPTRGPKPAAKKGIYRPKQTAESQSLAGRARKLFGRGGAARLAHDGNLPNGTSVTTPENVVFEGHRAREGQGSSVLKQGRKGKGKGKGKPTTRSSRRGAAFKAGGIKKTRG